MDKLLHNQINEINFKNKKEILVTDEFKVDKSDEIVNEFLKLKKIELDNEKYEFFN